MVVCFKRVISLIPNNNNANYNMVQELGKVGVFGARGNGKVIGCSPKFLYLHPFINELLSLAVSRSL